MAAGQARDSKGRFISMKVKVEFEDAASTKVGALEKRLEQFAAIAERAGGVGVRLGHRIETIGTKTVAYARTLGLLSEMMGKSEMAGHTMASNALHAVAKHMESVGIHTQRAGAWILRSGAAIMDFGTKVKNTLTPMAQWMQKSTTLKVAMTGMRIAAIGLAQPLKMVGLVGWQAFKSVAMAVKNAYQSMGGLSGMLGGIKGRLLGLASKITGPLSVEGLNEINSKFENINVDLAQTIVLMSHGAKPFSQAMSEADKMMGKIVAAAGPLPGEASDYAKAMALAGSVANRATGSQEKALKIVTDMTALWGGDGVMAAKMVNQALDVSRGRLATAGQNAQKFLEIMRAVPGQANLSALAFNKMNLDKRLNLVNQALAISQGKIAALANTYDAKMGAAKANWEWLMKNMSPKIFDAMKAGLDMFNNAIMDDEGNFTDLAKAVITVSNNISDYLVAGMKQAGVLAKQLQGWFNGFVHSENFEAISHTADVMLTAATKSVGAFASGMGGGDAIQERLEAWGDMVTSSVLPIFDQAATIVGPLAAVWGSMTGVVLDTLYPAFMGLFDAIGQLMGPLTAFYNGVVGVVQSMIGYLRPHLINLGNKLGAFFHRVVEFIVPVLRVMLHLYKIMASYLAPVIGVVVDAFTVLIQGLGMFLSWLGGVIGKAADGLGIPQLQTQTPETGALGAMESFLDGLSRTAPNAPPEPEKVGGDAGGEMAPAARGGGKTVQDFRFSRFDISQKFDESFDPDRVATVFASQLGRIGDRKLQSGFDPMFSLR